MNPFLTGHGDSRYVYVHLSMFFCLLQRLFFVPGKSRFLAGFSVRLRLDVTKNLLSNWNDEDRLERGPLRLSYPFEAYIMLLCFEGTLLWLA